MLPEAVPDVTGDLIATRCTKGGFRDLIAYQLRFHNPIRRTQELSSKRNIVRSLGERSGNLEPIAKEHYLRTLSGRSSTIPDIVSHMPNALIERADPREL